MQFKLHYRGPLHSNADGPRKQAIRRAIHPQLKTLWESPDLSIWRERDWTLPGGDERWVRQRGAFRFIPLVNHKLRNVASLRISWLKPGPQGTLINASGDIDNRLKTLFDALRVPNQAPIGDMPKPSEVPFYCLLDDDTLISNVEVSTDRLLEPDVPEMHVEMIISVSIQSSLMSLPQPVFYQL